MSASDIDEEDKKSTLVPDGRRLVDVAVTAHQLEHMDEIERKLISVETRVSQLYDAVQPIIDAVHAAKSGLVKIGKISDWLDRWGKRFMKLFVWAVGIYAAGRLIVHGGTFSEAVEAIWKAIKP